MPDTRRTFETAFWDILTDVQEPAALPSAPEGESVEATRVAVVIEDEEDIRGLLSAVLAQAGFTVYGAADGHEGLELVRVHQPLVTTLDVPTLKNVKIACETLDLLNFPKPRRHLVLNRADDKVGLAPEKVETTLDMKTAQAIPTSPEVANATNAGEPITSSHPQHPVSLALNRLADIATSAGAAANAGPSAASEKSSRAASAPKRGLLRRGR